MIKEIKSKSRFVILITLSFLVIILSFLISALTPLAKYKFLSDDPIHFKILATIAASYDATVIGFNSIRTITDNYDPNQPISIPKIELTVEPGSIQNSARDLERFGTGSRG